MMKHEFEERVGVEISDREYELIETVYTWHPAISEVGGKDQIATLYKTGGMPLIKSMLEAASIMMDLEKERQQAMRRLEEILKRIKAVTAGDLTEELCRRDAKSLWKKCKGTKEWDIAVSFLEEKYGKGLTEDVVKEAEA